MSKRHLKSAVLLSNMWCSFQTWSHLCQLATLFFQWLINSTLPLYLTFYQEISLTVVSKNFKDWTSNYHLFRATFISRLELLRTACIFFPAKPTVPNIVAIIHAVFLKLVTGHGPCLSDLLAMPIIPFRSRVPKLPRTLNCPASSLPDLS